MNKKYQVFISSTYKDLQEERFAVSNILLSMGFIPVGMEQFPASNMSQMDYIKTIMKDCDYYLLILAGKYGSVNEKGVGFTESEYDYAISQEIPVMSFLIKDVGKLVSEKCEDTDIGRNNLKRFREKVSQSKMVSFYTNIGDLATKVAASMCECVQKFPARGWVRGDCTNDADNIARMKECVKQIISDCNIKDLFADQAIILDGGKA